MFFENVVSNFKKHNQIIYIILFNKIHYYNILYLFSSFNKLKLFNRTNLKIYPAIYVQFLSFIINNIYYKKIKKYHKSKKRYDSDIIFHKLVIMIWQAIITYYN